MDNFEWLRAEAAKQRVIDKARELLPSMYKNWTIRFNTDGDDLSQYHLLFTTFVQADNAVLTAYAHHSYPGVVIINLRYASSSMVNQWQHG